jgi:hypothetical protein
MAMDMEAFFGVLGPNGAVGIESEEFESDDFRPF